MDEKRKYYVSYHFQFGKGVCGGTEEINAVSFEDAIRQCRELHPMSGWIFAA